MNKPQEVFFTRILYASEIILIFGGLFLHRLSRILKVNIYWIRVPTNEISIKNAKPVKRIQIKVISVRQQERITPKATPEIEHFSAQFQIIQYYKYSLKEWNH